MNNSDKFSEEDLVICAVVLGKGSAKEKAKELFEHFDQECDGYLKKSEIDQMFINYACFVACILPIIATGKPEEDMLDIETIQWYQRGMARNLHNVIPKLIDLLLTPGTWNVHIDTFVDIMSRSDNAKLLTSCGLRQFVLKNGGFGRRKSKTQNIYYEL